MRRGGGAEVPGGGVQEVIGLSVCVRCALQEVIGLRVCVRCAVQEVIGLRVCVRCAVQEVIGVSVCARCAARVETEVLSRCYKLGHTHAPPHRVQ